jgi:broad specificity phosphatase PhoE
MYLFLIRHGQSEGNVARRLQGWQDAPLTPLGEQQAIRAATALATFLQAAGVSVATVYSSPLQRALRTADVISQAIGAPLEIDPGLREMHFGRIEGLTDAEWKDCFPELLPDWHRHDNLDFGWPEGETRRAFYTRIEQAIDGIVARQAPGANPVIVAHGGVISSYLSHLTTGEWHHWRRFSVGNCSITHVTLEPDRPTPPAMSCLLRFNETSHLDDPDVEAVTGEEDAGSAA